jgi:hypothetical protein
VNRRIAVCRLAALLLVHSICLPAENNAEPFFGPPKSSKAKLRSSETTSGTPAWEVHTNITIQPGKAYAVDSDLDFSAASSVAVTLRAATSSAADLASVTLVSYWSVPDAGHYNPAEAMHGAEFLYSNAGGVLFQSFGSQFRLILRNDTDRTISIQELVLFCRSR